MGPVLKSSWKTFYDEGFVKSHCKILTGVRCCWSVSSFLLEEEFRSLTQRRRLMVFFSPFPSVRAIGSFHVIDGESLKDHTDKSSSLPQKTLLLKRLICRPAINSV